MSREMLNGVSVSCCYFTGPPGAGKTSLCIALRNLFHSASDPNRIVLVVNLDCGSDVTSIKWDIDAREVADVGSIMQDLGLGPNGAQLRAMTVIESTLGSWFVKRLVEVVESRRKAAPNAYSVLLLFDMPGQIELYLHHDACHKFIKSMELEFRAHQTSIFLVDAVSILDEARLTASSLMALTSMMQLATSQINLLTKTDYLRTVDERVWELLMERFEADSCITLSGEWSGVDYLDLPQRNKKILAAIKGVIEENNMLSFIPISIDDPRLVSHVAKEVDRCLGYFEISYDSTET